MFPFYLHQQLQGVHIAIVSDNAKTHKMKSTGLDRRNQFARSRSEPLVTKPTGFLTRGGSRRNLQRKRRPGMCRWNSFTNRSSKTPTVHEEEGEPQLVEKKSPPRNLMVNAPKPVRRGSWTPIDASLGLPKRKPSMDMTRESSSFLSSPTRTSQ